MVVYSIRITNVYIYINTFMKKKQNVQLSSNISIRVPVASK